MKCSFKVQNKKKAGLKSFLDNFQILLKIFSSICYMQYAHFENLFKQTVCGSGLFGQLYIKNS